MSTDDNERIWAITVCYGDGYTYSVDVPEFFFKTKDAAEAFAIENNLLDEDRYYIEELKLIG